MSGSFSSVVRRSLTGGAVLALAGAGFLTGCSPTESAQGQSGSSSEQEQNTSAVSADDISVDGTWIKAAKTGEMTGAFGVIKNNSSEDITLDSVTSDASKMVELHETVMDGGSTKMRKVEGGFTIKAGEELILKPGDNHIMLMDLTKDLLPGETMNLELSFNGGKVKQTMLFDIREFSGAQEEYSDIEHEMDAHENHEGHNHDGESHEGHDH